MPSYVDRMTAAQLIRPPSFLKSNIAYETMMGSVAYGVSGDTSDMDVYGFCIPPKTFVFPHLAGEIDGFGRQKQRFEQWQQHGIHAPDDQGGRGRVYDFSIYSIVRYFSLLMENNPNIVDSIFVPQSCILHVTAVGSMVREKRHMFLHKGSWHKFKGYSYSQLHKMSGKKPVGKRVAIREEFGYDVKFAYNVVRLLYEAEQILQEGDIDLQRHKEHLKAIRRGKVSEQDVRDWASAKESVLERLYETSSLRHSPDEQQIKQLLLDCLEHHFGSLSGAIVNPAESDVALRKIHAITEQYIGRTSSRLD